MNNQTKIVVVGSGAVGSTFAYTVLLRGLADELVIIDKNQDKAEGDALDLNHGLLLAQPMKITAGDYPDCKDADIIVITAGAAQKPGETRLDLMQRNVSIYHQILTEILKYNSEAIFLIATNPVDILTYITIKLTHLPKERVIGSGTLLDSARFRYLISEKMNIDPRSIHGMIIGEHGDTELAAWSLLNIAGMTQEQVKEQSRYYLSSAEKEEIYLQTKNAAYQIIEKKGSTYYAIALSLARICEAILHDQMSILPVSAYLDNYKGISDVCLGIPSIIGKNGIEEVLDLPLTKEEEEKLQHSANQLGNFIHQIQLPKI
ncbi:L-lactate dehydrogenase [Tepidibacillus infernus]|uniref:L-lactate dehydrogenase n=1 Tax=Tepidibacillus decaturensis TaxID=1413211 RepID=A0A135L174_9BACI|nr:MULTISPECIES: L-lactate dehydrogenase [Tepidibacillus]KXG42734.1 L-lactate dehydrogenase [Tepidibacillus decaturensis]GBF10682.1 L-lactate dehydrogenase P [Tepidibacillus sp. HK-1]